MRKLGLLLPLLAGACARTAPPAAAALATTLGESARYRCADGRQLDVLYSGGEAAVVTLGGDSIELRRVPAAQGERYVGGGVEWWGTGAREGRLTAPAAARDSVATACRAG